MSTVNLELYRKCCKFSEYPIIIAGETMADIYGWTSYFGPIYYLGDEGYSQQGLVRIGPKEGFVGNSVIKSNGNLKFAGNIETLLSLVMYPDQHWSYAAICFCIRYFDEEVRWQDAIERAGLKETLYDRVHTAVKLKECGPLLIEDLDYKFGEGR